MNPGPDRPPRVLFQVGASTLRRTRGGFNFNRPDPAFWQHFEQRILDLQRLGIEDKNIYAPLEDMSRGMQQKVAIARAFLTSPVLLLLDEAGAGLNASELAELMEMLKTLRRKRDMTLCVVEHVMPMVMGLCERIIVLDYGELIAEGTPEMISKNEKVIEAYLGRRSKR